MIQEIFLPFGKHAKGYRMTDIDEMLA